MKLFRIDFVKPGLDGIDLGCMYVDVESETEARQIAKKKADGHNVWFEVNPIKFHT